MGCAASKLDQLPAVSLCRDRCHFLDDALQQSYALADAHVAYMQSLKTFGPTLRSFFDQNLKSTSANDPAVSSVSAEKPPKKDSPLSSPDHSLSSSNSDSHIQFDTDGEDEETDKDFCASFNQIPNYNGNTYHNSEFSGSEWNITPPPPAPRSGAWDYLNFFDQLYERYELPYSSSKAVKNKEGSHEAQPVKQIHGEVKTEENQIKEAVSAKNGDAKPDNKKKVDSNSTTDLNEPKNQSTKQSVSEVMNELRVLFEKTSESGNEVLKMLDTGKFRYHHKKSVYQGSTMIFHMIASNSSETESILSKQKIDSMENDHDEIVCSQNLSSILRKLCMWETKLYDEVKAEEKLRLIHAKTCRQMKSLNQKGTSARRVDSTKNLIRAVSTKMRVAVQVIDKVAITINKLMDEELWPQINELIHRLFGMWKVMLECHNSQCQKVMEAKCLDSIALNEKLSDGDLEVAMRLKLELQNWSLSFSSWIEAQRGFVKGLNGWIRRCLLYDPNETADDGVNRPPPVFVILNKWSEAMDKLSEKEVAEAVQLLLTSVNGVVEQHNADLQQRVIADKDMERKVKMLEKEGQKMQKLMQARVKKLTRLAKEESDVLLPKEAADRSDTKDANRSDTKDANSLLHGLKHIFMAMEKFATHSRQAYEELHNCIEESKASEDKP